MFLGLSGGGFDGAERKFPTQGPNLPVGQEEQRKQMREIREAGGSREEVGAVLTEEQREQLDVMWRERRADQSR